MSAASRCTATRPLTNIDIAGSKVLCPKEHSGDESHDCTKNSVPEKQICNTRNDYANACAQQRVVEHERRHCDEVLRFVMRPASSDGQQDDVSVHVSDRRKRSWMGGRDKVKWETFRCLSVTRLGSSSSLPVTPTQVTNSKVTSAKISEPS